MLIGPRWTACVPSRVLVVLFFHAGIPWFSGGFVGVDVFS